MDYVANLDQKLDLLLERTARTETGLGNLKKDVDKLSASIEKYNEIEIGLKLVENTVTKMEKNCARIQSEKAVAARRKAVPWGAIIGSIMSGTIVGLIMLAANQLVR